MARVVLAGVSRHYGALRKAMPVTFLTFSMGYLAIIGFPGFSGFWSKDTIATLGRLGVRYTMAVRTNTKGIAAAIAAMDSEAWVDIDYTPDGVALNNIGKRTDFSLRAHRNSRKEQRQHER